MIAVPLAVTAPRLFSPHISKSTRRSLLSSRLAITLPLRQVVSPAALNDHSTAYSFVKKPQQAATAHPAAALAPWALDTFLSNLCRLEDHTWRLCGVRLRRLTIVPQRISPILNLCRTFAVAGGQAVGGGE